MKTAMQELIEIYEYYHSFEEFNEWFMDMGKKAMLEKEKEQIKDAYHKGGYLLTKKPYGVFVKEVEEYYNENYNQNK